MTSIAQKVEQLSQKLKQRNWKITVAESCTGGGLAYHLTDLAGSSDWFERGFVTYSNLSKSDLLHVNPLTLDKHGAVSAETATEMAQGALQNSAADISIAITGIAGPGGGTQDKPVGTVWFGLATAHTSTHAQKLFSGTRTDIRDQAIEFALDYVLTTLTEIS